MSFSSWLSSLRSQDLSLSTSVFSHPNLLTALLVLFPISVLTWWARRRARRRLAKFGRPEALAALLPERRLLRRFLAGLAASLGLTGLGLGMAGPRWGAAEEHATATGRDLVAVLDLSRSMLAEDALPNRAERGRRALLELADAAGQRGGNRLGLVVFASRAKLLCPLTQDLDHFREVLRDLDVKYPPSDTRTAGPKAASGTRIGDGVRLAVGALDGRRPGCQDVLLLSDGDDPAGDEEWQLGMRAAQQAGVAVFTVGLGDPAHDSRIPGPDSAGFLRFKGEEVTTRLQEEPLETLARLTGGRYRPARLDPPRLGEFFGTVIEPRGRLPLDEDAVPLPESRQMWFLAPALPLLLLGLWLGDPPGRAWVDLPPV
jgi:Ca-activated chloride channel family protein